MAFQLNRWSRRLHRWGAIISAIPLLLVIVTGLLLQIKKQSTWVQPATSKGSGSVPTIPWESVLHIASAHPDANVQSWSDIDRLDVRPSKGIIKIQSKNSWELQIDAESGQLLSSAYRRSDWIESLHDGSYFSDGAKLWVFLPNGLILLGLWVSGGYLWYVHIAAKRKKKKRLSEKAKASKESKD